MQRLIKEINSKSDSLFTKKRSNSFQHNINFTEKLSPPKNLHPNKILKIDNYVLNKKLGQGTFGLVVLAIHEITGEKVAIKILDKEKIFRNSEKHRFERKIQIMKKMYHKNIVRLYNVIENYKEIFLVMEYIQGQELFDYISNKKRLTEIESCKIFQQIISGIEYLSKTKVAHRDLKPENLLLDSKKIIKIVDFGLSNTYYENELLTTACGSPCYAAPEILQGKKYKGVEVDIWSSGIILYAMLCGYLPFEDKNNQNLYKKIIKGEFVTPKYLSSDVVDFLHKILTVEPENRYNINQIKNHPWFNLINPKINLNGGLLIDKYIIPFDEEIIKEMVQKYFYNEQIVKINIIINKHNHITTTYYLMLQKKIRNGKETIGDMNSKLFLKYIKDSNNLLIKYHYDLNKIIVERIFNKDKDFIEKENNKNKNFELKEIRDKNIKKPQINLFEDNISNFNKQSNYKKKEQRNIATKYIKINNNKKLQTIDSEKNDNDKKLNIKSNKEKSKDKKNFASFRDDKKIFKSKKKLQYYIGPKNVLSQKYFNSTYSENYKKNLSQTNEDISIDENIQKIIQNRIHILKDNILKSMNLTNNNYIQKTDNNISEINKENNLNSFISSSKQPTKDIKNNNYRYENLKTENKTSLNDIQHKIIYKNIHGTGTIKIIKKGEKNKNKRNKNILTEENEIYKKLSKYNFTKKNFHINITSRLSRTPNNILRNLNNRLFLEHNSINESKNINNYVTNKNNNINININVTNIIQNESDKKRDETFSKNNFYKEGNNLIRLNKFLDSSIKNKKYFFNTSMSLEKGRRQTESENKNNKIHLLFSNKNKKNYNKNTKNPKEIFSERMINDNQYLKLKSKNKIFYNSKINKSKNINSVKNIKNNNNSLNIYKLNKIGNNLAPIEKKHSNIYFNNNIKNNNQIRIKTQSNEKYIKINHSKKSINENKSNKKHVFKHLNTDFNRHSNSNKLSLTNIHYFSNRKNNIASLTVIKETNSKQGTNKKNKIISSKFDSNKKDYKFLSPFDLNFIIIINEGTDIKQKFNRFLNNKNIKYKNGGNNKYICSKNDMEFDLEIINSNFSDDDKYRIFIIKSFQKMFKSIKSKNLYNKYIYKLINSIK